jgi:hypothetical protein
MQQQRELEYLTQEGFIIDITLRGMQEKYVGNTAFV